MFNVCAPLDTSNWLDVATFMSSLMGNFMDVVQYNDDNRKVKVCASHAHANTHAPTTHAHTRVQVARCSDFHELSDGQLHGRGLVQRR